jgi:Kef-type K+ transport system membrane component KefB
MTLCELTPQTEANAFDFLTVEILLVLLVSNTLHFFFQRLGQPSIISQFLVSASIIHIGKLKDIKSFPSWYWL